MWVDSSQGLELGTNAHSTLLAGRLKKLERFHVGGA